MTRNLSKHLTVFAVLGAMAGATACTDLTENPVTEITEENFNPTEADLAALLGAVYTDLRGWFMGWYGYVDVLEETGDVLVTPQRPNGWVDGGVYRFRHEHSWTATRGSVNGAWGRSFGTIVEANRLINQIETGFVPLNPETERRTIAELRALRAYAYTYLIDWFGRAPISTDFTDTSLPQQASRQQLFDFIVSELEAVIPDLSEVTGAAMYGRINKWAALGILARTYLNAEVYTGTPRYDKVIELTTQIINSGKFSLDPEYRGVFSRNNHNSPEMIWGLPYDALNATGSNFHMKTLKPELRFVFGLSAEPWGGSAASPQFIDTYDPDDSRLADSWLMGEHFDEQGRGYDFVQHVPTMTGAEFRHGFPVWKYEVYSGETGCSDVDYPIIRYAEVLMMKAEALLRSGNAAGAAALVTQVRQRAFKGDAAAKATVTAADLMQGSKYNYGWYDTDGVVKTGPGGSPVQNGGADIQYGRFLDELGWEFAAEGHRRQHLIRFGVFTTKTWFNHEPNGDYRIIFALPNSAINTNNKLSQNPGY